MDVKPAFAEESLATALKVQNELIEKGTLDEKMIQCKEFEEKNCGTSDQVMTSHASVRRARSCRSRGPQRRNASS